jgi:release factor glutamine methyltransferase
MTLDELKQIFIDQLSSIYEVDEVESNFLIYIEDKLDLKFQPQLTIQNTKEVLSDLSELKQGKPIQHITQKAFFYDHFFYVNENTLIPRPETEELIELIRNDFPQDKKLSIVDLGTGTGCIPITLSKLFPNAQVSALDVSSKALEVAQLNAKNLAASVHFIQQDLLQNFELNEKFDIIISNPPYIRNLEKSEMHQNVLDFEPHLALFVEDHDPLIFYRKVFDFAEKHLKENGTIYCEINQYLGDETKQIFQKKYPNTQIIKDISGNDRMLKSSIS